MRIAIVSGIHGNRTALEAVLADLRQTSPDLILPAAIRRTEAPVPRRLWIAFAIPAGKAWLAIPMKCFPTPGH